MWLIEIGECYNDYPLTTSVFDYKKDAVKELKKLGFKFDNFNNVFQLEKGNRIYWGWIEKIDKNKIDKDLLI